MFRGSFYAHRSQKGKKMSSHQYFVALLGSASVKAAQLMLVKLIPDINFNNILQDARFFDNILLKKNVLTQNVGREKLLTEKSCIVLMKLTHGYCFFYVNQRRFKGRTYCI